MKEEKLKKEREEKARIAAEEAKAEKRDDRAGGHRLPVARRRRANR